MVGSDFPFAHDKRQNGWILLYNHNLVITDATKLALHELSKDNPNWYSEELIWVRDNSLKIGANLGQYDAEYLLAHLDRIPAVPETITTILFPGTIWCDPKEAKLLMPMLWNCGGEWKLVFRSFFDTLSLHDCLLDRN